MGFISAELNARFFKNLGMQVVRFEQPAITLTLNHFDFRKVIDVGANVGQFALLLEKFNFSGEIYSVEPSSSAFEKLLVNSKRFPTWHVMPRCALGRAEGVASLNVSKNSYSSSLLQILPKHTFAAPDSHYIEEESVSIKTLDGIFNTSEFLSRSCFLKIDVQGFESEVLAGGGNLLSKIGGIKIELSLSSLYEGQASYKQLLDQLDSLGFVIWNLEPGFRNMKSGETYQFDAILIHQSLLRPTDAH